MQAALLLGCSSQGGGKSARDRNLFLEATEEEPLSVILLISSVVVSPGSPFWGLHALLHPMGNRGDLLPRLPCTWLPGLFQKEHHNRGIFVQKRAQLGKQPLPLHFPPEEKLTPSTCQGMSIPSLVFPDGPETAHNAEPKKRNLQPKLVPLQTVLDFLPQLGDMDGVIC